MARYFCLGRAGWVVNEPAAMAQRPKVHRACLLAKTRRRCPAIVSIEARYHASPCMSEAAHASHWRHEPATAARYHESHDGNVQHPGLLTLPGRAALRRQPRRINVVGIPTFT